MTGSANAQNGQFRRVLYGQPAGRDWRAERGSVRGYHELLTSLAA